jgi:hypothetical protein
LAWLFGFFEGLMQDEQPERRSRFLQDENSEVRQQNGAFVRINSVTIPANRY